MRCADVPCVKLSGTTVPWLCFCSVSSPIASAARIQLKGFIVFDYFPRMAEFYAAMAPWVASGTVKSRETVIDGLENTPDAFLGLFKGENTGKMLVRL